MRPLRKILVYLVGGPHDDTWVEMVGGSVYRFTHWFSEPPYEKFYDYHIVHAERVHPDDPDYIAFAIAICPD